MLTKSNYGATNNFGSGKVWQNGLMVSTPLLFPDNGTIAENIKRLVLQNQTTVFLQLEKYSGITLPKTNIEDVNYYITDDNITFDSNFISTNSGTKLTINVDNFDYVFANSGSMVNKKTSFIIKVSVPSMNDGKTFNSDVGLSLIMDGLVNILTSCDTREYLLNWPKFLSENITDVNIEKLKRMEAYYPKIELFLGNDKGVNGNGGNNANGLELSNRSNLESVFTGSSINSIGQVILTFNMILNNGK